MINYSESAFHYSSQELARHGELMATLNAAIDNVNNRIQWDHNCDQALLELRERMQNLKRAGNFALALPSASLAMRPVSRLR